jgi:hypothetical protein
MTTETTYHLIVEPDDDVRPDEFECYDADDLERFERGEWTYVFAYPRVTVWDGRKGTTITYQQAGIGGIDWAFDKASESNLLELAQDMINELAASTGLALPPAAEWEIKP